MVTEKRNWEIMYDIPTILWKQRSTKFENFECGMIRHFTVSLKDGTEHNFYNFCGPTNNINFYYALQE